MTGPAALSRAFSASSQLNSMSRVSVYWGTSWLSVSRRAIAWRVALSASNRSPAASGAAGPATAVELFVA